MSRKYLIALIGAGALLAGTFPSFGGPRAGGTPGHPSAPLVAPVAAPPNPPDQNRPNPNGNNNNNNTAGNTAAGTTTTQPQIGETTANGNANANGTVNGNTTVTGNVNTTTAANLGAVPPFAPGITAGSTTITGKVFGTGGKTYFVGSDGILYFVGADNLLHPFGRFLPQTTFGGTNTTSVGVANSAGQGMVTNNTAANGQTTALQQRQINAGQTASPANSQLQSGVTNNNASVNAQINTPPATPLLNAGATGQLTPTGTSTNGVRVLSSPSITGQVIGNDGKTLFIGADGFIYYQGQDGMLHVFGSGAP